MMLLYREHLEGMYKVKNLLFGIVSAMAIFQRFMVTTLSQISGTCPYMNDIVFSAVTWEEHACTLDMIIERTNQHD